MHIRMAFALAFFFVFVFVGLRPAHAGFCTVEEIEEATRRENPLPLEEILQFCDELDVNPERCDTVKVFYLLQEGYTLSDVYYECR